MSGSPTGAGELSGRLSPTVGVLALQGDFAAHIATLDALGIAVVEVRNTADLARCDGLVLPGGESTTIGKLLVRYDLMGALRLRISQGMPVFGTCAGMILLSTRIHAGEAQGGQPLIGAIEMSVDRNGYGRQVDSFEANIPVQLPDGTIEVRGLFIRAPVVRDIGPEVEVLGSYEGQPVLVRQGNAIAASFHPELVGETRVHAAFVDIVRSQSQRVSGV